MPRSGEDEEIDPDWHGRDDDLIELRDTLRAASSTASQGGWQTWARSRSQRFVSLILPGALGPSPPPRRTTHHHHSSSHRASSSRQSQGDGAPVIDLTEEPDSPNERQPPQAQHRNPRRRNSQRTSPPRLSRSDSTFMGRDVGVIDLTADSPEGERRNNSNRPNIASGSSSQNSFPRREPRRPHLTPLSPDQLIQLQLFGRAEREYSEFSRRMALRSEFGFPYQINVVRNHSPMARPPSPKPPMDPPPPTKDGFTRNTRADPEEEMVVVCPCCSEELAYDPDEIAPPAAGTRKRKRAPGEHHFWALKKCGHVYCAECFDNRKPSKAYPNGAGFHVPPGKTHNEIRCVVDGCNTKAAAKTEWVGIFL